MVSVFHSLKRILKNRRLKIRICDGVHFQGYVVDVCNKTIVHVDSLRNNDSKTQPQKQLQLPYLITRTLTSNLTLNEESSLTPTVVVFRLLPVLLLMFVHFLCHRD